jgi:hypothetical protein
MATRDETERAGVSFLIKYRGSRFKARRFSHGLSDSCFGENHRMFNPVRLFNILLVETFLTCVRKLSVSFEKGDGNEQRTEKFSLAANLLHPG